MRVQVHVHRDGREVGTLWGDLEEPRRASGNRSAELYIRIPRDADVQAGDVLVPDPIAYTALGSRITRGEHTRVPLRTNLEWGP